LRRIFRACGLNFTRGTEDAGACIVWSLRAEFGPRFYGLPLNERIHYLASQSWTVPDAYPFGAMVVPMRAGECCAGGDVSPSAN
jgi:dihydroorotase